MVEEVIGEMVGCHCRIQNFTVAQENDTVDDVWYDLQGRIVAGPTDPTVFQRLPKGVYLHGERKVVVR